MEFFGGAAFVLLLFILLSDKIIAFLIIAVGIGILLLVGYVAFTCLSYKQKIKDESKKREEEELRRQTKVYPAPFTKEIQTIGSRVEELNNKDQSGNKDTEK